MHLIKNSIEIKAPVERVWEFLTTPNNLTGIWPSMVEVRNAKRRADGGHSFDWVYKMAGISFEGHAEATKVEPNRFIEVRNDSGIPSTFRWRYDGSGPTTRLEVEVEYDMPMPVIGRLAEAVVAKVNERELETVLANAKTVLEHGAQRPAQAAAAPAMR